MTHKLLTFMAIFAAALPTSSALILDCTYSMFAVWNVNAYTCTGKVIFVNDPRSVIEVSGNHMASRNHSEVLQLSIRDKNVKFIPRHLGAFFPNLESMDMYNSAVETVSKLDFAGLPNLKQFHFNDNKITIVVNDLFAKNPKMKWISFINNPVTNIGYNVFDSLADLTSLRFDGVTCHNAGPDNNPAASKALIAKLFANCPPTLEMTFAKIKEAILKEAVDGKAIQINLSGTAEKSESDENENYETKRILNDHENRIIKLENDEKLGIRGLFN